MGYPRWVGSCLGSSQLTWLHWQKLCVSQYNAVVVNHFTGLGGGKMGLLGGVEAANTVHEWHQPNIMARKCWYDLKVSCMKSQLANACLAATRGCLEATVTQI
jgi:hypothetical protein